MANHKRRRPRRVPRLGTSHRLGNARHAKPLAVRRVEQRERAVTVAPEQKRRVRKLFGYEETVHWGVALWNGQTESTYSHWYGTERQRDQAFGQRWRQLRSLARARMLSSKHKLRRVTR